MELYDTDVKKVAGLSRIYVGKTEAATYARDLSKILDFMVELQDLDCTGVEPMTGVVNKAQRLRADVKKEGGCRALVLQNAPESEENFFVVPKVIE